MKKVHRAKLAELGVTSEAYTNAGEVWSSLNDDHHWPPVWGITLDGPRANMVVENTPSAYGGDGKWHLKWTKFNKKSVAVFNTQREAIAGYLQRVYLV